MRRRGFRGGRARSAGAGRLLDRLRELRGLALRDVRALERPEGTPSGIELGTGLEDGSLPVVLVASRRDGIDLAGWARVAVSLCARPPDEVIVAAPSIGPRTRRALVREAEAGLPVRLIAAPVLAESGDHAFAEEELVDLGRAGWQPSSPALVDRVVRVIEAAAIVTGAGALRRTGQGYALYVRGVPALDVTPEGDGVAVTVSQPEKQHIHVTDANFPRWGLELHELVVQLAQDPRLIERPEEHRGRAAERAATDAGVRIAARWLPWDGADQGAIDWVGIDGAGRPALGVALPSVGLADVPALVAGLHVLAEEASVWVPAARGRPRVVLATEQLDGRARALLEALDLDLETRALAAPAEAEPDTERRGRRRGRRRRRDRADGDAAADGSTERAAAPRQPSDAEAPAEGEESATEGAEERARRGARGSRRRHESRDRLGSAAEEGRAEGAEPEGARDEEEEPAAGSVESPAPRREGQRGRRERGRERRRGERSAEAGRDRTGDGEAAVVEEPAGAEAEAEAEAEADVAEPVATTAAETPAAEPEVGELAPEEPEPEMAAGGVATLHADAGPEEQEESEEPPAPEPRRRRRARAAIAVRNDTAAILAALVLARERRHVPFFWVCAQDELMDFFRGKATDLDDNTDLLLVGFTAQPVPSEVIGAAELYRGRIHWFDAHPWPIEDLEALRAAIGEDSVVVPQGASGPLAAVGEVTERRSRFTDKVVDLSARRLGENDMGKWGYRLVGLLGRLAQTTGDHRAAVQPILAGRPTELPPVEAVYAEEERWLESNDPTVVHFGEYQMAVLRVPPHLDAGELGRRARLKTGARLSLATREGDELVMLGSNEEKRHINVMGLVERLDSEVPWAHARPGGDRLGRLHLEALSQRPDRFDAVIEEIVRHKSILYG